MEQWEGFPLWMLLHDPAEKRVVQCFHVCLLDLEPHFLVERLQEKEQEMHDLIDLESSYLTLR